MSSIQKNVFNKEIEEDESSGKKRSKKRLTRRRKTYRLIAGLFILILCLNIYTIAKKSITGYLKEKNQTVLGEINFDPDSTIEEVEEFKIHFLYAGRGDAILIQVGDTDVLINTGQKVEAKELVKKLDSLIRDKKIEYIYVTEMGKGMVGGLLEVTKTFDIENGYHSYDKDYKDNEYEQAKAEIRKTGKYMNITMQNLDLGSGVTMSVLPCGEEKAVISVTKKDKSFLYLGTLSKEEETELDGKLVKPTIYLFPNFGEYRDSARDSSVNYYIVSSSKLSEKTLADLKSQTRSTHQIIFTYEQGVITFKFEDGKFVLQK